MSINPQEKETKMPDGTILIEFRLPSSGAIDAWLDEKVKEGHKLRSRGLGNDGLYYGIVEKKVEKKEEA